MQPNPVPHVAVEYDRAALDHADRQLLRPIAFQDVEQHQLADSYRLTADRDPLVVSMTLHDHVVEHPQDAITAVLELEPPAAAPTVHCSRELSKRGTDQRTGWDFMDLLGVLGV